MKQMPTTQLPIRDFAKKKICDGHLFLAGPGGRKFYLMKPGVLIDPEFIKRHAKINSIFEYQSVLNEEIKQQFKNELKALRYLSFERDLRLKVIEIVKLFQDVHSKGEHFLNFALACFEEFCEIPSEFVLKMHETDMFLFRKALYSASFAVIIGMSNDFYHPLILKDFFNLTLALDLGLCEINYSYYVARACNIENQSPGSGRDFMVQEHATPGEIKVFLDHPVRSHHFFKTNPDILAHQELAEVALYQHELADGTGFPRGIPKGLISSWESVVILADSLVEIQDQYLFENDVLNYINSFKNEKLKDLPVGRVFRKLCDSLEFFAKMKETAS